MYDVPRSLQSWVSTIQTVVLTADVFQLFTKKWKKSAVSTTDWRVETQLCKVREPCVDPRTVVLSVAQTTTKRDSRGSAIRDRNPGDENARYGPAAGRWYYTAILKENCVHELTRYKNRRAVIHTTTDTNDRVTREISDDREELLFVQVKLPSTSYCWSCCSCMVRPSIPPRSSHVYVRVRRTPTTAVRGTVFFSY